MTGFDNWDWSDDCDGVICSDDRGSGDDDVCDKKETCSGIGTFTETAHVCAKVDDAVCRPPLDKPETFGVAAPTVGSGQAALPSPSVEKKLVLLPQPFASLTDASKKGV